MFLISSRQTCLVGGALGWLDLEANSTVVMNSLSSSRTEGFCPHRKRKHGVQSKQTQTPSNSPPPRLNKSSTDADCMQLHFHICPTPSDPSRSCVGDCTKKKPKEKLFFTVKAKADMNICLKVQKGNPQIHALQIILLHTPLHELQIACSPSP